MSTENRLVDERPATLAEHIQLIKDTTKQAAIVPHAWLDEWLKEAERQEQTIADLRARVEAMQKAGDAMHDAASDILNRSTDKQIQKEMELDLLLIEWKISTTTTPTPTDHE